jgi:hypothetical protein
LRTRAAAMTPGIQEVATSQGREEEEEEMEMVGRLRREHPLKCKT